MSDAVQVPKSHQQDAKHTVPESNDERNPELESPISTTVQTVASGQPITPGIVRGLQRSHGNQATINMLGRKPQRKRGSAGGLIAHYSKTDVQAKPFSVQDGQENESLEDNAGRSADYLNGAAAPPDGNNKGAKSNAHIQRSANHASPVTSTAVPKSTVQRGFFSKAASSVGKGVKSAATSAGSAAKEAGTMALGQTAKLAKGVVGGLQGGLTGAAKVILGPFYPLIMMAAGKGDKSEGKNVSYWGKENDQYMAMLKEGKDNPYGEDDASKFLTGLSFFTNVVVGKFGEWTGWASLITGIIGAIGVATGGWGAPLLGISQTLASVSTLANLAKAGLSAVLAGFSGSRASSLYKKLPDTIPASDEGLMKKRNQYLVAVREFGKNIEGVASGAFDAALAAAPGAAQLGKGAKAGYRGAKGGGKIAGMKGAWKGAKGQSKQAKALTKQGFKDAYNPMEGVRAAKGNSFKVGNTASKEAKLTSQMDDKYDDLFKAKSSKDVDKVGKDYKKLHQEKEDLDYLKKIHNDPETAVIKKELDDKKLLLAEEKKKPVMFQDKDKVNKLDGEVKSLDEEYAGRAVKDGDSRMRTVDDYGEEIRNSKLLKIGIGTGTGFGAGKSKSDKHQDSETWNDKGWGDEDWGAKDEHFQETETETRGKAGATEYKKSDLPTLGEKALAGVINGFAAFAALMAVLRVIYSGLAPVGVAITWLLGKINSLAKWISKIGIPVNTVTEWLSNAWKSISDWVSNAYTSFDAIDKGGEKMKEDA